MRKTAGNVVELGSIAAFGFSPLWLLAAGADVTHGSRVYLDAFVRELKVAGVLAEEAHLRTVDELLAALEGGTGTTARLIDIPPLEVAALKRSLADLRADASGLPSPKEMSALFDGLRSEAVRERSTLLEVSTGVGIAFFNSARHIGRQHVLDPYGEDLKPLRDEGFAAYSARVAKPYGSAIARHFDPERATLTERGIDKLKRDRMKDLARQRYDEACAFDRSGREAEAIPCYEEALELGLPDGLRRQALLGLGSSYRNVLRHADAISLLEAPSTSTRTMLPCRSSSRSRSGAAAASARRCSHDRPRALESRRPRRLRPRRLVLPRPARLSTVGEVVEPTFRSSVTRLVGDEAREWLAGLPALEVELAARWGLELGDELSGGCLHPSARFDAQTPRTPCSSSPARGIERPTRSRAYGSGVVARRRRCSRPTRSGAHSCSSASRLARARPMPTRSRLHRS